LRKEFKDRTGSLPLNGLAPFAPWLLALKAAGKLRGAAKTITRSTVSTATALSLTALVATGIGGWVGGGAAQVPGRLNTAPGGATFVSASTDSADAAHRVVGAAQARPVRTALSPAASVTATGTRALPVDAKACAVAARHGVCSSTGRVEYTDTTIQIGPTLPDNPTGRDAVVVMTDNVDCTAVPTVDPVVHCTQQPPAPGGSNDSAPPAPSAAEGALR
jgi:hypothetical protein